MASTTDGLFSARSDGVTLYISSGRPPFSMLIAQIPFSCFLRAGPRPDYPYDSVELGITAYACSQDFHDAILLEQQCRLHRTDPRTNVYSDTSLSLQFTPRRWADTLYHHPEQVRG
jgi:hypothetical protein